MCPSGEVARRTKGIFEGRQAVYKDHQDISKAPAFIELIPVSSSYAKRTITLVSQKINEKR